jgi:hypothetical protein
MSFLLSLKVSLHQNRRRRELNKFCLDAGVGWGGGEVAACEYVCGGGAQTVYTHVSKCENDKIKVEKIEKKMIQY